MTLMKEKLQEAYEAKNNDTKSFIWKFAKQPDGTQESIRLVDATPEQLNTFYKHCYSMLYNEDKNNPGRYPLLDLIAEQRNKCNVELFLRGLENGSIAENHEKWPRFVYMQSLNACLDKNREVFPRDKLNEHYIWECTGGLPAEFKNLAISDVIDGALDRLGKLSTRHITLNFIISLGVHLTQSEYNEFNATDENGKPRSKLEQLKERLNIKPTVHLIAMPQGLNFTELRAMITLRPKKYSELTTDQLTVLRNKVLFRLEDEVRKHIAQWEDKIKQIEKVAQDKGISLSV